MTVEIALILLNAMLGAVNLAFILKILYNHLERIETKIDQHIQNHAKGEFR